MEIFWKLIFAAAIAFSSISLADFVIYSAREAPKSANFTRGFWFFGFLCSIYVIYQVLP